jgi:hypothetical protein
MALRIARGLFRLWLVLSVLWIGATGTVVWFTLSPAKETASEALQFDPSQPYEVLPPGYVIDPFDPNKFAASKRTEAIKIGTELALIPSVLVLVIGSALGWAFRGFRT